MLFEMISGRPPFHGENHIDLLRNIQRKAVRLPADVRVSKECVNLLRLLLNRNPLTRAGFKEFFDACDAFVGLGCEGEALQPTEDSGSILQKPSGLLPLGPISEGDESQMHGAGSMATIATAAAPNMNTYQRQLSGRDSERNTPNPSPPPSQYEEIPTTTIPATTTTVAAPSTPMNVVSPPLAPSTAPSIAPQPTFMPSNTPYAQRRGSHFAPLQPSPPGPSAYYATAMPPPMSLGGGLPHHLPAHGHNAVVPSSHDQGYPGQHHPRQQHRGDSSQSSSDDSEFVMVQHGGSPSASTSPAASQKGSDQARHNTHQQAVSSAPKTWKPVTPGSRFVHRIQSAVSSPPASPGRSSSHSNTVIPSRPSSSRSNTSSPYATKGILSTSPSTGGALVGMMGGMIGMAIGSGPGQGGEGEGGAAYQLQKEGTVDNSNTEQFQTISKFETIGKRQQGSGTSNIKLAAKMLSAAEDVGRRAVTVAHLGDTRAYLAMRLIMTGSLQSSSSTPMEGVEEETNEQGSDGGDTTSSNTMIATGRRRAVSTDRPASMEEDNDEEDDEMPFAISADSDTDPSGALAPMLAAHVSRGSSVINPKHGSVGGHRSSPSNAAMIQVHFREALSCYVKALSMIKGAVGAAQRVSAELDLEGQASTTSGPKSLPPDGDRLAPLKRRCEVSHGWLTGQFKGVLERADAANAKIAELEKTAQESTTASTGSGGSTSSAAGAAAAHSSTTSSSSANVAKVEELIYNHSLACGRDGAVKQLLGQNEVARSCYRSAGLLAETLLMETKLGDGDKTILENLVEGFAERITELDTIMLQQSRGSSTVGSGAGASLQALRRSSSLPKGGGGGLNSVAEHAHGLETDEDHQQALQHTETY